MDTRRFSTYSQVLRMCAASTWYQVACRGYGAGTFPSLRGERIFRVHPSLLPSTFFPAPYTPSPIPFRHNNRAVSQRVFNGRRLHATKPQAGRSSSRPLPSCSFSFSCPFFSNFFFSFCLSLYHSLLYFSYSSIFVPYLSSVLISPCFTCYLLPYYPRPFSIFTKTRDDQHQSKQTKIILFIFSIILFYRIHQINFHQRYTHMYVYM